MSYLFHKFYSKFLIKLKWLRSTAASAILRAWYMSLFGFFVFSTSLLSFSLFSYNDYKTFEEFSIVNGIPVSYGSDYHGPTIAREMLSRGENVLDKGLLKLLARL